MKGRNRENLHYTERGGWGGEKRKSLRDRERDRGVGGYNKMGHTILEQ